MRITLTSEEEIKLLKLELRHKDAAIMNLQQALEDAYERIRKITS